MTALSSGLVPAMRLFLSVSSVPQLPSLPFVSRNPSSDVKVWHVPPCLLRLYLSPVLFCNRRFASYPQKSLGSQRAGPAAAPRTAGRGGERDQVKATGDRCLQQPAEGDSCVCALPRDDEVMLNLRQICCPGLCTVVQAFRPAHVTMPLSCTHLLCRLYVRAVGLALLHVIVLQISFSLPVISHTTYKNKAPCALFHVFGCFCLKLGFFCHSFNIVLKFRPVLSPFIFKCLLTLLLSGGMAVGGFVTLHSNSGKHHKKSLFLVWCFIVSII